MLKFTTASKTSSPSTQFDRLPQVTQDSIAVPSAPVQTRRPRLSMVWHKEWDGQRERMVAHWVVNQ